MRTVEQIAQLFENMGYVIDYVVGNTIEVVKYDGTDWTERELDTLYDEAGMYDSVRVSQIYSDPTVAQIEVGV
jgi:membrane protein implicated in regulation of membrane protease activity